MVYELTMSDCISEPRCWVDLGVYVFSWQSCTVCPCMQGPPNSGVSKCNLTKQFLQLSSPPPSEISNKKGVILRQKRSLHRTICCTRLYAPSYLSDCISRPHEWRTLAYKGIQYRIAIKTRTHQVSSIRGVAKCNLTEFNDRDRHG